MSTSFDVIVECNDATETHIHEEGSENSTEGKQFRWNKEQTDIIFKVAKPNVIKRNLNNAKVFTKSSKAHLYKNGKPLK